MKNFEFTCKYTGEYRWNVKVPKI